MKLQFLYSPAYDRMLMSLMGQTYDWIKEAKAKSFIKKFEKEWVKEEKGITKEIEKVSGLKFRKNVDCFVIEDMVYVALSNPLTIKVHKSMRQVRNNLIHELIHIILTQNKKSIKLIKILNKSYPKKDPFYKTHLALFIIERKVMDNLYGKNYFERAIKEDEEVEDMQELREEFNKLYPHFKKDIIDFFERRITQK